MTIDVAIRARLLDIGAVTALVSTRVFAVHLPPKPTFPCVKVERISQIEDMHLRGPIGLFQARVQVSSIAKTKPSVDEIDAAVQGNGLGPNATGLKGWAGDVGGSPPFVIVAILPDGVRDLYEPPEVSLYSVQRDFVVFFHGDQ